MISPALLIAFAVRAHADRVDGLSGGVVGFVVFSAACFLLIASAVKDRTDYPHLFFAAMLFQGCGSSRRLPSPLASSFRNRSGISTFSGAMDRVLLVATVGVAGYVCAARARHTLCAGPTGSDPAQGSVRLLGALWVFAIIAACAIAALNFTFGLMVRGHVPAITLPWPLGGLLSVSMDIGIPLYS